MTRVNMIHVEFNEIKNNINNINIIILLFKYLNINIYNI